MFLFQMLDFAFTGWYINNDVIVFLELSWPKFGNWDLYQVLGDWLILLLHELLVPQVELHIVNLVKRHLCGLTLPDIRNEVSNDIFQCLFSDVSLTLQLLLQSLLYLAQLHLVVVISLLESCCLIGIVRVRILPELPHERHSLLAIPPLFPVRNEQPFDDCGI